MKYLKSYWRWAAVTDTIQPPCQAHAKRREVCPLRANGSPPNRAMKARHGKHGSIDERLTMRDSAKVASTGPNRCSLFSQQEEFKQ